MQVEPLESGTERRPLVQRGPLVATQYVGLDVRHVRDAVVGILQPVIEPVQVDPIVVQAGVSIVSIAHHGVLPGALRLAVSGRRNDDVLASLGPRTLPVPTHEVEEEQGFANAQIVPRVHVQRRNIEAVVVAGVANLGPIRIVQRPQEELIPIPARLVDALQHASDRKGLQLGRDVHRGRGRKASGRARHPGKPAVTGRQGEDATLQRTK